MIAMSFFLFSVFDESNISARVTSVFAVVIDAVIGLILKRRGTESAWFKRARMKFENRARLGWNCYVAVSVIN